MKSSFGGQILQKLLKKTKILGRWPVYPRVDDRFCKIELKY